MDLVPFMKEKKKNKKRRKKIIEIKRIKRKPSKKVVPVVYKLGKNFKLKKIKKIRKGKTPRKASKKSAQILKPKEISHKLERFRGNPIIYPANGMHWESRATFNPTAFEHDGKIHVIYRAIGEDDISTLGYASSRDGLSLRERTFQPIYVHKQQTPVNKEEEFAFYSSGGSWNGGAEDPRITKINEKLYMTYTAFNGWGSVRIGLTSILLEDFLNKKWNWRKPVLISPPGEIHKNWAVFPEKINGQYAMIHSISPNILIDYFDDLDSLDGQKYIKSNFNGKPDWDSGMKSVRGIGPAPIKTKFGWLVLYHAMEKADPNRYKLFAMILDKKNPTKILHRSHKAVLEPDEFYENEGHKPGVIYSCGAVIKGDNLYVYYGGADMVSCVATTNLNDFLKKLTTVGVVKLSKKKSK